MFSWKIITVTRVKIALKLRVGLLIFAPLSISLFQAHTMATGGIDSIEELNNRFRTFMLSAENIENAIEEIYDDLVDEVLMGFVFDVHRSVKCGLFEAEEGIDDANDFKIIDAPGLDVFGEPMKSRNEKCTCPNCDNIVSANRFATHLEKCLGMGRNSSRAASSRRSTITSLEEVKSNESDIHNDDEDDDDDDWNTTKKRKRRFTKKRTSTRKYVNRKYDSDASTSN